MCVWHLVENAIQVFYSSICKISGFIVTRQLRILIHVKSTFFLTKVHVNNPVETGIVWGYLACWWKAVSIIQIAVISNSNIVGLMHQ